MAKRELVLWKRTVEIDSQLADEIEESLVLARLLDYQLEFYSGNTIRKLFCNLQDDNDVVKFVLHFYFNGDCIRQIQLTICANDRNLYDRFEEKHGRTNIYSDGVDNTLFTPIQTLKEWL